MHRFLECNVTFQRNSTVPWSGHMCLLIYFHPGLELILPGSLLWEFHLSTLARKRHFYGFVPKKPHEPVALPSLLLLTGRRSSLRTPCWLRATISTSSNHLKSFQRNTKCGSTWQPHAVLWSHFPGCSSPSPIFHRIIKNLQQLLKIHTHAIMA